MELKTELYQQRNEIEQLKERLTNMNDNNKALIEQTAALKERMIKESKMKSNMRTTKYDKLS